MNPAAKLLAREAGFLTASDKLRTATQTREIPGKVLGMRILGQPWMPEGYVALVTDRGAMILPPSGKPYYLDLAVTPTELKVQQ